MSRKLFALIFSSYAIILLLFIVYSFTQVDLNLTLSSIPIYQKAQSYLTFIGYFRRNYSTAIFIILLILISSAYIFFLWLIKKNLLKTNQVFKLILLTTLLIFAYPAFSHDIFNYMFDARIVTKYQLDPQYFKALDFPHDPWTRYMRWTHRYYPYGPLWLWITLIPSFLGFGKFVITLGFFKLLFLTSHLGNCLLIWKITGKLNSSFRNQAIAMYGLHPLILVEGLVSPHNESVMLFFTLLAIWFFITQKMASSILALIASAAIKFISIIILPLWYLREKVKTEKLLVFAIFLWIIGLIPVVLQREIYSWYFLPLIGLVSIFPHKRWLSISIIGFGNALILRYWPFLYTGEYNTWSQQMQMWTTIGGGLLYSTLLTLVWSKS